MGRIGAGLLLAATPALARADIDLPPDAPLQVSINSDASAPKGAVRSNTELVLQPRLSDVDAKLSVSFAAGQRGDSNTPWAGVVGFTPYNWSHAGVALQAGWTAPLGAKLQLEASDELRTQTYLGPSATSSRPISLDEAGGASLKASKSLAAGLALSLEAGLGSDDGAVDLIHGAPGLHRVPIRDEHDDLSSHLAWTPTPKLSVEFGDKIEDRSLAWGYDGLTDDFAAVEPKAAAVLKPVDGAELSLTLEQATSPLQPAKFAALAEAAVSAGLPAVGSRLRPDQSWQFKAGLKRKFKTSGELTLAYTQADLQSSTELVEIAPGLQAPGSVAGGQRRQWDMSLNLPLRLIGLRDLSLQGSGLLRWSEIPDPITGVMRPPSGETPYEAKLGLVADLPASRLRLGVQSQASGPQTVYSLTRVDEVTITPSLGAFIEYRPADFALKLQLDDLTGADRRYVSTLYAETRDDPPIGETDRRIAGGAGFTLSLTRAL
jgi:opacity protein-like surface antigen